MEVFRSAQFWELPNIRGKFLKLFYRVHLSNVNLDVFLNLLHKMTSMPEATGPRAVDLAALLKRLSIYQHLLFFPMEYFSWQLFNDLMKRAVEADMALCEVVSDHNQGATEVLITLRVFLKRAYAYSGSVAQDSVRLVTVPILISLICLNPAEHRTGTVFGSSFEKSDAITRVNPRFQKSHSGLSSDLFLVGWDIPFCSDAQPMTL